VPKTAKFTQEKQNGNRLRRESTPIKHGTLCLPEVLEQEANRTKILDELEMTTEHHSTVRRYVSCICLLSHAIPTLSQQHYWPASEESAGLVSREVICT